MTAAESTEFASQQEPVERICRDVMPVLADVDQSAESRFSSL